MAEGNPDPGHTANLLGALSLVVADRTADAMAAASGLSGTGATVLSALLHFLERPTIDLLRRVLGLTSSGTVRLVDRLVEAGYVERLPGTDARSTSVGLTAEGRAVAERVTAARAGVLTDALSDLSEEERRTLDALTGRILTRYIRGPGAVRWNCRQCDMEACGRYRGECPVGNEAMRRYPSEASSERRRDR